MKKALAEIRNINKSINFKMNTVLLVISILSALGLILNFVVK